MLPGDLLCFVEQIDQSVYLVAVSIKLEIPRHSEILIMFGLTGELVRSFGAVLRISGQFRCLWITI